MTSNAVPRVHIGPAARDELVAAVEAAGAQVAALGEADAVVWTDSDPTNFPRELPIGVRWVQLPSAGVERWVDAVDERRTWTSAVGAYAPTVAEHALALLLAGTRQLPASIRATEWQKREIGGAITPLRGATVAIVGCGGIGRSLIGLLAPFDVEVLAVTRSGTPVPGAARTLPAERTAEVWPAADHVVVAAPATATTQHLVGAEQLAAMRPGAWLVNVARGSLVDTDALVDALDRGAIGGAALDVTDPEPLPAGHPLWGHPRAIVTPHVANPRPLLAAAYAERVQENVSRFREGEPLIGAIDPAAGY
ncbi:D-isomer specific 2-hydroxyacid dehydrogenase family protein [Pseudonocardia nigra]|uniref:D-isomer specific 2-hydroxyacid dehydrogenase family protein n=1 Tax=Pseudonocardia nigra TaxID=1921578 RepID=UPI001C5FA7FB|nr:D-isomer specific 2-hydroxyacid dehydrogenase family protein [Pseudonocardia nigra]